MDWAHAVVIEGQYTWAFAIIINFSSWIHIVLNLIIYSALKWYTIDRNAPDIVVCFFEVVFEIWFSRNFPVFRQIFTAYDIV